MVPVFMCLLLQSFHDAPYHFTEQTIQAVQELVEEARSELEMARQQALPPDDGALLERMGKVLSSILGAEEPSFTASRLSDKPAGVIVNCLKEFILCPMKGELLASGL